MYKFVALLSIIKELYTPRIAHLGALSSQHKCTVVPGPLLEVARTPGRTPLKRHCDLFSYTLALPARYLTMCLVVVFMPG
jgi:hypothetical protein